MKIKKIYNNNVVLVNQEGKDYIWVGTGLGFQKKPGQIADEDKIEKVFVLHQKNSAERFTNLLKDIPIRYASLADDIIKYAKERIRHHISDTIYVSLTDHLYNLVKLEREGISVQNRLSWEIKKFYPVEFSVGKYAVKLIEEAELLSLNQTEAGNIAMHFINAQINENAEQTEDILTLTQKIKDITSLIRLHNKIDIDENSLAFDRFVTHLRFFFKRIDAIEEKEQGNPLLVHVIEKYPKAYETTKLVEGYLNITLYDDEQLYLTLHIQKLIENE